MKSFQRRNINNLQNPNFNKYQNKYRNLNIYTYQGPNDKVNMNLINNNLINNNPIEIAVF